MKSDLQKAFVINETAARKFGWVDSASMVRDELCQCHWQDDFSRELILMVTSLHVMVMIIGVVKDFHYASMRNPIEPLVILLNDQDRNTVFCQYPDRWQEPPEIPLNTSTRSDRNSRISIPLNIEFLDENLREYYQGEKRIGMLAQDLCPAHHYYCSTGFAWAFIIPHTNPDPGNRYPENFGCFSQIILC